MSLHAKIMNLPALEYPIGDAGRHYLSGHRDARHAAAELALEAEAELEALRKDAERYRWLRDPNNMRARELFRHYGDADAADLDAAIDDAMKGQS